MKTMNHIRLVIAVSFFLLLALPLAAQERGDSVFTFRFLAGKNMFFAPGLNNGEELSRLYDCVDRFKEKINNREILLHVDGYYVPGGRKPDNAATAKIRSNRVKSELISRKGLKEDNFITRNQPGADNYVTVSLFVPKEYVLATQEPSQLEASQPEAVTPPEEDRQPTEEDRQPTDASEPTVEESAEEPTPDNDANIDKAVSALNDHFALKTNLLYYAILIPNLELEWMCAPRWSVALEAQGNWYAKSDPRKVYRVATIIPEARYWVIERSRWHGMYVGVFAGAGLYDLSNSKKGHEGEGYMAGASVGYMWPISKHFSLDAGLGLGYLRLRDKQYRPYDGHFLYELTKNINYFGPLRLKISLGWRF